ncbi:MAG: hypothetical protein ACRDL7_04990 [Gaiellaceae bacterium]
MAIISFHPTKLLSIDCNLLKDRRSYREFKTYLANTHHLKGYFFDFTMNFKLPAFARGESDGTAVRLITPRRLLGGGVHVTPGSLGSMNGEGVTKREYEMFLHKFVKVKKNVLRFFNNDALARRVRLCHDLNHDMVAERQVRKRKNREEAVPEKVWRQCAYCFDAKTGRGYRASTRCTTCNIFLCTERRDGAYKTCVEKWHSQCVLEPRK